MVATLAAVGSLLFQGLVNFAGPLVTRRTPVVTVVMVAQGAAAAPLMVVLLITGESLPGLGFAAIAAASGIVTLVCTIAAFRAGQIGQIGIVSVLITMSTIIPAVAGIVVGDRPAPTQWLGIALAACGTGLVLSKDLGARKAARDLEAGAHAAAAPVGAGATAPIVRPGMVMVRSVSNNWRLMAIMAAVGFGFFLLVFAKLSEESLIWAGAINRSSMALGGVAIIVALRLPLLAPGNARRQIVPLPFLGIGMITAVLLFGFAASRMLTVASAICSFSPVVTTALSWAILHERLLPAQIAGLIIAVAGLFLIAV